MFLVVTVVISSMVVLLLIVFRERFTDATVRFKPLIALSRAARYDPTLTLERGMCCVVVDRTANVTMPFIAMEPRPALAGVLSRHAPCRNEVLCDEDNDRCFDCLVDADCDDGSSATEPRHALTASALRALRPAVMICYAMRTMTSVWNALRMATARRDMNACPTEPAAQHLACGRG